MRTWRVGTVSMGSALLLLGVFLLFATFTGVELNSVLMSWWPMILIVLGMEILLYLFLRGKQELDLKYDVFSILFIGFIGTVAVGFAIVSSLGIAEKVTATITSEEVTNDLPVLEETLSTDIKRIVLETNQEDLSIEGTNDRNVHIFGTYKQHVSSEDSSLVTETSDYVSLNERGDTLYVTLKDLPTKTNWHNYDSTVSANVLVPNDVKLEVRSARTNLSLRPRTIMTDWSVDGGNSVSLYVPEESDVLIESGRVQQMLGDLEWEETEKGENVGQVDEQIMGRILLGNGKHQIRVGNVYEVAVYKE